MLRSVLSSHARRGYSTVAAKSNIGYYLGAAAVTGAAGYYILSREKKPQNVNYQQVYNEIAGIMENNDYDDGSYGPVLLRLAWHASGTYDKSDNTGGSDGATMRFSPEADHDANAGLAVARNLLLGIKKAHPGITFSDLWSLAGVAAVQEMGGPDIAWRPGRSDKLAVGCAPDGRLPDASQSVPHVKQVFYRMGFNDQEIVALVGAHCLGRCHPDRSGFDGPWTFSPTTFTNDFFKLLLSEEWVVKKWGGPKQYVDKKTGQLMMLEGDMALLRDKEFKRWVEIYAKDEARFFRDFAAAFQKLEELGVPKEKLGPEIHFKRA